MLVRLALVCTVAIVAAFAATEHRCIHDEFHKLYAHEVRQVPKAQQHTFGKTAVNFLRIKISTEDLDDTSQHCTFAGQVISNRRGENVQCRSVDVLTAAKKSILVNNILPAALARLSSALHVERRTSNIIIPSGSCSGWKVPTDHFSTGVNDADYVLYVSAVPTTKNPVPTAEQEKASGATLAFASGCALDGNRYVAGRANWGPHFIEWGTPAAEEEQIATAVHELLHALGFSSAQFGNNVLTGRIRGKDVTYFNGSAAKSQCAAFLDCSTVKGCEIEDEGGAGSAGSHLDRRVYLEEIMAAAGGTKLSAITLGVMQDLGYVPQYSQAKSMTFGKHAGCDYTLSSCDTTLGGRGKWWCFDKTVTEACTVDKKAVGYCNVRDPDYSTDLPTYFQYFAGNPRRGGPEFTDKCPYIQGYSNRLCDVDLVESTNDYIIGNYYGTGGRCFTVTGLVQDRYQLPNPTAVGYRCLRSQCVSGTLQFQANASGWISCPTAGGVVSTIPGFDGSVTCPAATEMCATFVEDTPVTPVPTPSPVTSIDPVQGCVAPTTNVLPETTTCADYVTCKQRMCNCLGGSFTTSTAECAYGTNTCPQVAGCLPDFMSCVETAVSSAASSDCQTWAADAATDIMSIRAGASLTGSHIQNSCLYHVCKVKNATSSGACANSVDDAAICAFAASLTVSSQPSSAPGTAGGTTSAPSTVNIDSGASLAGLLFTILASVIVVLIGTS